MKKSYYDERNNTHLTTETFGDEGGFYHGHTGNFTEGD